MTRTYDATNQLTSQRRSGDWAYDQTYTYDALGKGFVDPSLPVRVEYNAVVRYWTVVDTSCATCKRTHWDTWLLVSFNQRIGGRLCRESKVVQLKGKKGETHGSFCSGLNLAPMPAPPSESHFSVSPPANLTFR